MWIDQMQARAVLRAQREAATPPPQAAPPRSPSGAARGR
jgi:hypothetical protein